MEERIEFEGEELRNVGRNMIIVFGIILYNCWCFPYTFDDLVIITGKLYLFNKYSNSLQEKILNSPASLFGSFPIIFILLNKESLFTEEIINLPLFFKTLFISFKALL